ncbi:hypothetical protein D9M71_710560 [compost metagenome]
MVKLRSAFEDYDVVTLMSKRFLPCEPLQVFELFVDSFQVASQFGFFAPLMSAHLFHIKFRHDANLKLRQFFDFLRLLQLVQG